MTKMGNIKGSAILLFAAFIWGIAFVAQSGAAEFVPPFLLNSLRSLIAAVALYIVYKIFPKKEKTFFPKDKGQRAVYLKAALICGICLAVSVNFQQFGIAAYPEGVASEARSGFITALYVVLVPIFSVFVGKRVHFIVWLAAAVAITGVYMLCLYGGIDALYLGDALVFVCAITFACHIMMADKYVETVGGIKLSIMQLFVCGILSLILSLIFEFSSITLENIISAMPQILYLGICSSGIAYTLQLVGQKYAQPAVASISMSFESVFAVLGGWLISGNSLSKTEIFGCVLMFCGIILAQIPELLVKKEKAI